MKGPIVLDAGPSINARQAEKRYTSDMDSDEIRASVKAKYASLPTEFPYPVGRESALRLGYDLAGIPEDVIEIFVGIGNPFRVRTPLPGERVLDVGCGGGMDSLVAARLGARVVGIDLTPEMFQRAKGRGVQFQEADAENLPFPDASFDQVISNGVLNLVPNKDKAFAEIRRVLRPGGVLAAADLLVVDSIPAEVLASMDAWST